MIIRVTIFSSYNDYKQTGEILRQVEKDYTSFSAALSAATRMENSLWRGYVHGKNKEPIAKIVEVVK